MSRLHFNLFYLAFGYIFSITCTILVQIPRPASYRSMMETISESSKRKNNLRRSVKKRFSDRLSYPVDYDDEVLDQLGSLSFPNEDEYVNAFETGSIVNDPIVDLDEMIAETSARWKCSVTAIVSNTVTANTTGAALAGNMTSRDGPFFTNTLSGSSSSSPQQAHHNQPSNSAIGINMLKPNTITRQSSIGSVAVPGMEHQVIEQQQAEIEALHAAILKQQQLQSSINYHRYNFHHPAHSKFNPGMFVLNENTEMESNQGHNLHPFRPDEGSNNTSAPVDHIEVNHDASDPNSSHYWQDDLTVWSGFNTVTGYTENVNNSNNFASGEDFIPSTKHADVVGQQGYKRRPDAESATGASALNGIPTRVVKDREIELSSGMTGVVRKAKYSGTINAHTRLPEGLGTFFFTKTGDIYQGEVHDGEMHGAGTYTFGRSNKRNGKSRSSRPKELKGTFEHNVFIG